MQIQMKTLLAGPAGVWQPGEIVTVSVETGKALVAGGFAEEISLQQSAVGGQPEENETATAPEGEKAVMPAVRSGKGTVQARKR